jgi:hypothetical protein
MRRSARNVEKRSGQALVAGQAGVVTIFVKRGETRLCNRGNRNRETRESFCFQARPRLVLGWLLAGISATFSEPAGFLV